MVLWAELYIDHLFINVQWRSQASCHLSSQLVEIELYARLGSKLPISHHIRALRSLRAFSFSVRVDYLQSNRFYHSNPSTLACHLGCRQLSDCRTCDTFTEVESISPTRSLCVLHVGDNLRRLEFHPVLFRLEVDQCWE